MERELDATDRPRAIYGGWPAKLSAVLWLLLKLVTLPNSIREPTVTPESMHSSECI